jgi:hypothetical protein
MKRFRAPARNERYCSPAIARASPLSSRICMPVLARSTT